MFVSLLPLIHNLIKFRDPYMLPHFSVGSRTIAFTFVLPVNPLTKHQLNSGALFRTDLHAQDLVPLIAYAIIKFFWLRLLV